MATAVSAEQAWFALRVRPNHERTAERSLQHLGLESYLPVQRIRRAWSDRVKELEAVLFPGYVFCRFGFPDRMLVLNSAGVRSIVANGKHPLPVDESEIDAVRALVKSGCPILPCPYLEIGDRVVIRDGPLASLRGAVMRIKDSWRVVVSVEAISCSVSVEVDAASIARES